MLSCVQRKSVTRKRNGEMYRRSVFGYHIVTDTANERLLIPVLGSGLEDEPAPVFRLYSSLPHNLFRRFARLSRSEDAVLYFAEEYGELGLEQRTLTVPAVDEDMDSGEPDVFGFNTFDGLPGEYVEEWYERVSEMRYLVSLAEGLLAVKDGKLRRLMVNRLGQYWCSRDSRLVEWEASPEVRNLRSDFTPYRNDIRLTAREYICSSLFWNLMGGAISFDVRSDEDYRLELVETGNGLLNGMWLQFARWYSQESEHITHDGMLCSRPGCGARFAAKSLKRRFCSDACKQAMYRQRKNSRR